MHSVTLDLSAAGVGLILAGLAFIFARHNHKDGSSAHKSAFILALGAGFCLSASVAGWLGGLIDSQVAGVAVVLIIVVLGGVELIFHMRGFGHSAKLTPILAFAVALALPLCPGALGQIGQSASTHTVNIVHSGTTKLGG